MSVLMSVTAVTAARRETWSANDTPMPAARFSDAAPRLRYDLRAVRGMIPQVCGRAPRLPRRRCR